MENIIKEKWANIEGYSSLSVSNFGNFKRVEKGVESYIKVAKNLARVTFNNKTIAFNVGLELLKYFAVDEISYPLFIEPPSIEGEVWKEIMMEGVPDGYFVSTMGRIKKKATIKYSDSFPMLNSAKLISCYANSADRYTTFAPTRTCKLYVHRVVATMFLENKGNLPFVNHKDGNGRNNNVSNLEWVSHRENLTHAKIDKPCSSKYPGVRKCSNKKKWRATVRIDNVIYNLGSHDTEELAHQAYLQALKEHGITNKYAQPIPEKRQLWKRPYYEKSSPNYLNRDAR